MEALAGLPLEFKDFSGGMTDNFFEGDVRRYKKADNYFITVDKQLENRYGTKIYDSVGYTLEGGDTPNSRITGLQVAQNDSILLGVSSRNIFLQPMPDTAWGKIPGVAGNEALSAGGPYSQVSFAEFQKQIFFTSDALSRPGKLYQNEDDVWVAQTVGLPQMKGEPNYTESELLTRCIALVNQIRASFIAHLKDEPNLPTYTVDFFSDTVQHKWLHKRALAYFEPVVYNVEDPQQAPAVPPTPAPVATDLASLLTLCNALSAAYDLHRLDLSGIAPANGSVGTLYYHQWCPVYLSGQAGLGGTFFGGKGISAPLEAKVPTDTYEAATFLDDLFQKHYWHMLAPNSHAALNSYSTMSRYLIPTSYKIGVVTEGEPLVVPNLDPFIDMASYMQFAFNGHVLGQTAPGFQHFQRDLYSQITLPYPTDFDSAALTIFWCRWMYGAIHQFDQKYPIRQNITFTMVAGSPNITSVVNSDTGGAITLSVDDWIGVYTNWFNSPMPEDAFCARVKTSGSGTATLDRTASASVALVPGQAGIARFHGAYVNTLFVSKGLQNTVPVGELLAGGNFAYAFTGNSLRTWITLAEDFVVAMGAHDADSTFHKLGQYMGGRFNLAQASINIRGGNSFYIPEAVSYVYSFFYANSYTVGQDGVEYLTRGNPIVSQQVITCPSYPVGTLISSVDTGVYTDTTIVSNNKCATVTRMEPLSNDSTTNYDLTNITEEVYRTSSGGTVGYLLASLPNGTTDYNDFTNDTLGDAEYPALVTNKPLYTNGGVLGSEQPPKCKFIHVLNSYVYYGAVQEINGTFLPNRLIQSTQYAPDAVPSANYLDLDDKLTGITSARNVLIAMCETSIYRVEGNFDSTGKGFLTPQKISEKMGCLNAKSIVQTEIGTFFAGSDGFYYTDGYQIIKVSIDLNQSYRNLTKTDVQKSRIYGSYDKSTRRIWWAMQSKPTGSDNDIFYVYYLDYGVKPGGVFTTATAQFLKSWAPASVAFYKGNLVVGDTQGYLFKSDPYTKTDPKITYGVDPAEWSELHIPWDYQSCALNYGTIYKRKWITALHLAGPNVGDVAMQIQSIRDNNATGNGIQNLVPLQYHGNFVWGDPNFIWGEESFKWKYDGDVDVFRRFPAGSMRSDFRQVRFFPADVTVYRSDSYPLGCTVDTDGPSNIASIATPTGYTKITFPDDVIDMRICFDYDEYATEFKIIGFTDGGSTVFLENPNNLLQSVPNCQWEIRGVKKNQRHRVSSYVVHYGYLGDMVDSVNGPSDTNGQGNNK